MTGGVEGSSSRRSAVGKSFGGITALSDVDFDSQGRRGARARRRERRRQVNADEDPRRRARQRGRHSARRRAGAIRRRPDAERAGVAIIHQELTVLERTAADNIFLGREPLIAGRSRPRPHLERARALSPASASHRPATPRRGASRRPAADGRDRQGAVARRAHSRDGRADGGAFGSRERALFGRVARLAAAASPSFHFAPHRRKSSGSATVSPCCGTAGSPTAPLEKLSSRAMISLMVGREVALIPPEQRPPRARRARRPRPVARHGEPRAALRAARGELRSAERRDAGDRRAAGRGEDGDPRELHLRRRPRQA